MSVNTNKCLICGSDRLVPVLEAKDRNFNTTDRVFKVYKCPSCLILQNLPPPAEAETKNYYPAVYYPTKQTTDSYYRRYIERYQIDKINKIKKIKEEGNLLDVGCGAGHFILTANRHGYRAEGIEYSEDAGRAGRNRWGLPIITGDFLTYPFGKETYSIVTLWQVLEHLPQPKSVLKKLNDILKSGGLLVIAVPNISSIQAKIFREKWYHLDIPRHIFHYSPISLTKLVESCGFKVFKIDYTSREHNFAGILGSIMKMSHPDESFMHKLIRKTVGTSLARALASVEAILASGGTFTLFAYKR